MKTWKEAILKVLLENKKVMSYMGVYEEIKKNNYYKWSETAETPWFTVSRELGDFIRSGDNRVKKIKRNGKIYYYLAKHENELNLNDFVNEEVEKNDLNNKQEKYKERDLHKLFVSYLKNENIFAKTIYHEKNNREDHNQKWVNPDIIGINFIDLKNEVSKKFQKNVDKSNMFDLYSYELKREINNDYSLKESYFQAVSNSSWANYGYLVALEINDNLFDEIKRLNKTFGIGVIKLNSNPFETEILFQAKRKKVDFQTIDKLIAINTEFKYFIENINNILDSNNKNLEETLKRDFGNNFCDDFFDTNSDSEIEKYCNFKKIPFNRESDNS